MDAPAVELSYVVRYGATRILGEFTARGLPALARGAAVILRSERGHEWGTVLCAATEQTRTYLGDARPHGRIVRLPTPDDEAQWDRARQMERGEFLSCKELIAEKKLQMQLVDVEHLFGGERAIFYYVAEQRVDFRELVKALAARHKIRIEMRQIGVRDEAKLLADYGDCGQPVCCNTHLREMPPVSMKMAKLQKATLDPNKISGRCGRLKCCLRYEYDTYEEYRRELPPLGAVVVTRQGTGKVIAQEILSRKVMIVYENQRHLPADLKDIITVVNTKGSKAGPPKRSSVADDGPAGE
jgi:cell fate regulator YaaT (PSP1 superfamily)